MAKTGELVDARRVNEEYRRWISAQPPRYPTVREELADFSKHAEVYRDYEGSVVSALPCTDLRRVLADFDVSTALPLLLFLQLDAGLTEHQLADCLSVVESFVVRRAFVGEETKEYNKLFVEVIGSVRSIPADQVGGALRKKLLSGGGTTRRWPTDNEVTEAALSRPVYRAMTTPALRLILERLELNQRTKKSEGGEIPVGLQIEHVMPERWNAHWPIQGTTIPADVAMFPHLAKDDLARLAEAIRARNGQLQTLGNLTLLNKYLNPAASNGSYTMKQAEYVHSVLRLNRYFDGLPTWDEGAIARRGKALGTAFCEVWKRPA